MICYALDLILTNLMVMYLQYYQWMIVFSQPKSKSKSKSKAVNILRAFMIPVSWSLVGTILSLSRCVG